MEPADVRTCHAGRPAVYVTTFAKVRLATAEHDQSDDPEQD